MEGAARERIPGRRRGCASVRREAWRLVRVRPETRRLVRVRPETRRLVRVRPERRRLVRVRPQRRRLVRVRPRGGALSGCGPRGGALSGCGRGGALSGCGPRGGALSGCGPRGGALSGCGPRGGALSGCGPRGGALSGCGPRGGALSGCAGLWPAGTITGPRCMVVHGRRPPARMALARGGTITGLRRMVVHGPPARAGRMPAHPGSRRLPDRPEGWRRLRACEPARASRGPERRADGGAREVQNVGSRTFSYPTARIRQAPSDRPRSLIVNSISYRPTSK